MVVSIELDPTLDEAAYDRWYDENHIPEILACPGFRFGTRYTEARDGTRDSPRRDLTVYTITGAEALHSAEFTQRRGFGSFRDQVHFTTRVYRRRAAA